MWKSIMLAALTISMVGAAALAQMPPPASAPAGPTGGAQTDGSGQGRDGMAACRADMQSLCAGQSGQGGRGARVLCLVQNRDKVSPACAVALSAIAERGPRAAAKAAREARPGRACRSDAQALCGSVERGAARQQCLLQHESQLSQPYKDALTNVMSQRREARAACRTDRQTLCQGDTRAQGGAMRCLRDNQSKLSPQCAAALARLPAPRAAATNTPAAR